MTDEVPDFPPGPRGPEESYAGVPGQRVRLGDDQIQYVWRCVEGTDGASSVEIEELGAGHFQVRVFDRDNAVIFKRRVFPIIGQFTDPHSTDND